MDFVYKQGTTVHKFDIKHELKQSDKPDLW